MKTDAVNLGALITSVQQRDAIHIAVYPVTATEELLPGTPIGFMPDSYSHVRNESVRSSPGIVGIVDPFLTAPVQTGQMFWMLLIPYSISTLRHEWTHPQIPQQADVRKNDSIQFLKAMGEQVGCTYEEFIGQIADGAVYTGAEEGVFEDQVERIKQHYTIATGLSVPEGMYFSCAC